MTDDRRWLTAPADQRIMVPLDSLTALYDHASGQTHLLASPLPEILTALDTGAATAAMLADRLATQFELDATDPLDALAARLSELEALGLVRWA